MRPAWVEALATAGPTAEAQELRAHEGHALNLCLPEADGLALRGDLPAPSRAAPFELRDLCVPELSTLFDHVEAALDLTTPAARRPVPDGRPALPSTGSGAVRDARVESGLTTSGSAAPFVPEAAPCRGSESRCSFGVYLNLVEGRLWVPDVGGSNPLTPTIRPAGVRRPLAIMTALLRP